MKLTPATLSKSTSTRIVAPVKAFKLQPRLRRNAPTTRFPSLTPSTTASPEPHILHPTQHHPFPKLSLSTRTKAEFRDAPMMRTTIGPNTVCATPHPMTDLQEEPPLLHLRPSSCVYYDAPTAPIQPQLLLPDNFF